MYIRIHFQIIFKPSFSHVGTVQRVTPLTPPALRIRTENTGSFPLKRNPAPSPWIAAPYQRLPDERLSIQQPQREEKKRKPFHPPYQRRRSLHTQARPGQTAIKTRGPLVGWRAPVNHRSINLISIRSPRPIDTSGLSGIDCVDWALACNYNRPCQRCITYDGEELSCYACDPVKQ